MRLLDNKQKEELFRNTIKPIFLHDFDDLISRIGHLLSLEKDFSSACLILIDELQTYGRQLSEDTYHELINPKDVGFHWKPSEGKLYLDIFATNTDVIKKCDSHTNVKINNLALKGRGMLFS